MKKVKYSFLIILCMFLIVGTFTATAEEEIKVFANGKEVFFDVAPYAENGRIMVPLRAIAEVMGAQVSYGVVNDGGGFSKPLNMVYLSTYDKYITMQIGEKTLTINGKSLEMDVSPVAHSDRTYVPVRFFCEAMDSEVSWDGETNSVNISGMREFTFDGICFKLPFGAEQIQKIPDFCESEIYWSFKTSEGSVDVYIEDLYRYSAGDIKTDCENLGLEFEKTLEREDIEGAMVSEENEGAETPKYDFIIKTQRERVYRMKIFASGEVMDKVAQECLNSISLTNYNWVGYFSALRYVVPLGKEYDMEDVYEENALKYVIRKLVATGEEAPCLTVTFSDKAVEYQVDDNAKKKKGTFVGEEILWYLSKDKDFSMYAFGKTSDGLNYSFTGKALDASCQLEFVELINSAYKAGGGMGGKPVIYLYPETKQEVNVRLELEGEFTFTYPVYENGWNVTAYPDGKIISQGEEYSYLFWEGTMPYLNTEITEGFVVKGSDSAEFLRKTLSAMGLTPKEYNEFIVFWAPKLMENEYNKIYFAGEEYEKQAKLTITPEPDSILRVYMIYEPATKETVLPPQTIKPFERKGFTVIEWGGHIR